MSVTIVKVAVEQTAFKFDSLYDYYLPCELADEVFAGCRVTVPFGRGNKPRKGIVVEVATEQEQGALKPVLRVVDKRPVFSDEMLKTAQYIKEQTFASLYDSLKAMLPKDAEKPDEMIKFVRLISVDGKKITEKQQCVIDILACEGVCPQKELIDRAGVGVGVVKTLEKNGVVECFEQSQAKGFIPDFQEGEMKNITLNTSQQQAFDTLNDLLKKNEPAAALLYGVTGSGKTSVYMKLVDEVINSGKGVIVMVPEIALTSQAVNIFKARYGNKVALFHSRLSDGERASEWRRVKCGEAIIALGTRSAVFAPFDKIGLIVMDEEQEHTYKSESSPRFHARDVARFRAAQHNALLLMASATPSVSTFARAKNGNYHLLRLEERFGDAQLPEVITVDMKAELKAGNTSVVSDKLLELLEECLENKNQAILLLNRRGYNTFVSCKSCGEVLVCEHCSISMAYHKSTNQLMCHYCGNTKPVPKKCPSCDGGVIAMAGVGTQRAVDELNMLLPNARILRMDADTTTGKTSHHDSLKAFADGEYDILVGTQMVAKGLDFPKVSLVGILCADQTIYNNDYRACERAFSLLTQVVGRAGRSGKKGLAVIQTVNPDNEIIKLAADQNYDEFFDMEYTMRKMMQYPPFCNVCVIGFVSDKEQSGYEGAQKFFEILTNRVQNEYSDVHIKILGPAPAGIMKIQDKYRHRMIVKCKNTKRFRKMIAECIGEFEKTPQFAKTSVSVDINPENII